MSASHRPILLVVDDEAAVLSIVTRVATRAGFDVVACHGGREALAEVERAHAQLALVDMRMPEVGGLEVIRAIRQADPECRVALMTGFASIDSAVEAIKLGASDYLTKPFELERLTALLNSVREDVQQRRTLLSLEGDVARRVTFCDMIGRSAVMQELFDLIRRLAPHVRTALIAGETGTGKELVARALHQTGPRRARKFVTINCSAVVETLFESELFGHVRGAFTGATDSKTGLFEAADGGTLFLDEVGELPPTVQAKLLRVLETGEVQRVGSLDSRKVDVHVIAATNRDLQVDMQTGKFRSDLYYRLNVVELRVPPLRERREDIPYLTAAFVQQVAKRIGKRLDGLTPAAERLLMAAPWDGNVRELRNALERACILADGPLVSERELSPSRMQKLVAPERARMGPAASAAAPSEAPSASLSEVEHDHILRAIERAGGNKKAAARALGISRRSLYRRLDRIRDKAAGNPPDPRVPRNCSEAPLKPPRQA